MPRAVLEGKTPNVHVPPKKMDKASPLFSPPLHVHFFLPFFPVLMDASAKKAPFSSSFFLHGALESVFPRESAYILHKVLLLWLFGLLSLLYPGERGGRGHTMAEDVLLSPSPPWQHPPSIHPGSDSGRLGYTVPRTLDNSLLTVVSHIIKHF